MPTISRTTVMVLTALVVIAAVVLAGCGAGFEVGTLATLDTRAVVDGVGGSSGPDSGSTSPLSAVGSGPSAGSSVVGDDPTSTDPPGIAMLSLDGPWRRVPSAPGVDRPGLYYELLPKVWAYLPVVENVARRVTVTLQPVDVPVIEGYLQAMRVFFLAMAGAVDGDDPAWDEWFTRDDNFLRTLVRDRLGAGGRGDLDLGIVLQPIVIDDERTDATAIVVDCLLDGSVWLDADGALAEGSRRGWGRLDRAARMVRVGDRWKVEAWGATVAACLA